MTIKQGDKRNLDLKRKLRSEMTPAETKLWFRLKSKQLCNLKFRRQHGIGPYIADFYCPAKNLVIEVDGDVHAQEKQIAKDRYRELWLKQLGLHIIRYNNNDILYNLENVMCDLFEKVARLPSLSAAKLPPLAPPYKGGELR